MTQQLTVKSDVYGFGVLMIELITVDSRSRKTNTFERFREICGFGNEVCQEEGAARPTMCEVVKEIENIMQIAPNTDSVSTSVGFEGLATILIARKASLFVAGPWHVKGKSRFQLDWTRRLSMALDSARG
ncbi:putative LRR receptor-like serine/threonine-protein kinase [Camellia lanceoleosa]|uniref:LRR receptor-like serine/threonine-protein kinase n=1 Tax=Camellia lanceoleosa TaxID=1840588 RepID=A0ACC0IBA5_9ERIC|nr:putative LRR receptor-like serine/threonine-protein kinase [Camellia lanceoleosa]